MQKSFCLLLITLIGVFYAHGQTFIKGYLSNKGTEEALPYVKISSNYSSITTFSDTSGIFNYPAPKNPSDSILFCRTGIKTLKLSAGEIYNAKKRNKEMVNIFLEDSIYALKPVLLDQKRAKMRYKEITEGIKGKILELDWHYQCIYHHYSNKIAFSFQTDTFEKLSDFNIEIGDWEDTSQAFTFFLVKKLPGQVFPDTSDYILRQSLKVKHRNDWQQYFFPALYLPRGEYFVMVDFTHLPILENCSYTFRLYKEKDTVNYAMLWHSDKEAMIPTARESTAEWKRFN